MTGRVVRLLVAAAVTALLAGCAGAPVQAGGVPAEPALPARPVELPLNGVDPCGLLTPAQLDAMKVPGRTASADPNADRFGSVGCSWGTAQLPPYGAPSIRLVTAQPIDYFDYMLDRKQVSDIDGFPTIRDNPQGRPEELCLLFVDIAQGQTLQVQYNKLYAEPGTINREQACAKARELGHAVIATLRAQQGK